MFTNIYYTTIHNYLADYLILGVSRVNNRKLPIVSRCHVI